MKLDIKNQISFKNLLRPVFVVCLSMFAVFLVAHAGTLTPSATPAPTSYTLDDIYTRLTTNATAVEGDHDLNAATTPAVTFHDLTDVYEAIPTITANTVKSGTTILGVAGTLLPNGGTAAVADLFNGKTAHLTGDYTLDTGTLDLACNTATFNGTANKVADSYDGGGDGTNRWCMTSSGDAVAGEIANGKIAWVDGQAVTGSASAGLTYGDNNAAYVLGTASAPGTALKNLWNGSNTGGTFPGGSQANGGVDDTNNGGTPASGRYTGTWTACNSGNNYCGTGASGADAKDDSTGLIWSAPCSGSGCSSFNESSPTTYTWDNSGGNNSSKTASDLCSTNGQSGWFLPHQKQILQAYIDGAYGNLTPTGSNLFLWSATTDAETTTNVYTISPSEGMQFATTKNDNNRIRCVRSS